MAREAVAAHEVRRGEHDLPSRRVLGGRDVLERRPEAVAVGEVLRDLVEGHRVALHDRVVEGQRGPDPDAQRPRADTPEQQPGMSAGAARAQRMLRAPMAASPAFTPPPGNPRFPLLDAMRGIAAGMIVLCHTAGVSTFSTDNALGAYAARLNMGVTLFFLLSGFLLYRPFFAARIQGRPPIRIRDYARRRVLRIVPAYWVALTVLALWPGLAGLWDGDWWRYYTFAQVYWRTRRCSASRRRGRCASRSRSTSRCRSSLPGSPASAADASRASRSGSSCSRSRRSRSPAWASGRTCRSPRARTSC